MDNDSELPVLESIIPNVLKSLTMRNFESIKNQLTEKKRLSILQKMLLLFSNRNGQNNKYNPSMIEQQIISETKEWLSAITVQGSFFSISLKNIEKIVNSLMARLA